MLVREQFGAVMGRVVIPRRSSTSCLLVVVILAGCGIGCDGFLPPFLETGMGLPGAFWDPLAWDDCEDDGDLIPGLGDCLAAGLAFLEEVISPPEPVLQFGRIIDGAFVETGYARVYLVQTPENVAAVVAAGGGTAVQLVWTYGGPRPETFYGIFCGLDFHRDDVGEEVRDEEAFRLVQSTGTEWVYWSKPVVLVLNPDLVGVTESVIVVLGAPNGGLRVRYPLLVKGT